MLRVVRQRIGVDGSWRVYGWPLERLRELMADHGVDRLVAAAGALAPVWLPGSALADALSDVIEHEASGRRPAPARRPELLRALIAARTEGGEPPAGTREATELAALRTELGETQAPAAGAPAS